MRTKLIMAAALLAACSSNPPPATQPSDPPPSLDRPTLAYAMPASSTLTYEYSDSTASDIQAGAAGAIRVNLGARGVVDLLFEPNGANLKVTVNVKEFSGSFVNSAGGGVVNASLADVKGPAVLTLSPRGEVTFVSKPEMTPIFRQVAGSDGIFRRFFSRLPGRRIEAGFSWTDTVSTQEVNEGLTTRTQNIVTSTFSRDSVIGGRTMLVITSVSERSLEMRGVTQGVEIIQKLSGPANAVTLWDPVRRLVVSRTESVRMNGTFDLPAMSMTNMPITSTGRVSLHLRD
jgi:hypothetical protein